MREREGETERASEKERERPPKQGATTLLEPVAETQNPWTALDPKPSPEVVLQDFRELHDL